jgi:hypothetical protein
MKIAILDALEELGKIAGGEKYYSVRVEAHYNAPQKLDR